MDTQAVHLWKQIETHQLSRNDRQCSETISIPYMPKSSKVIRRIMNPVDVQVVFLATNTLGTRFGSIKDPVDSDQKGDAIYKVSCLDCTTCYIGQTSRPVHTRMEEHSRMSKRVPKNPEERKGDEMNSGIASHVWDTKQNVNFTNPEIISEKWDIYR